MPKLIEYCYVVEFCVDAGRSELLSMIYLNPDQAIEDANNHPNKYSYKIYKLELKRS